MPSTGSDYGLRNNSVVEDRSDPVKSTDAAARYLKALFNQYHDWALALAAYNSGPGRVNSAIKRAHSTNFWVLQRYLPQETRNYVPAFIAATYICNYYQVHGLQPHDPDFDEQLTSYISVYEGMSFRAISDATGIEYGVIKGLNPGYKRDYVPPTVEGRYVILPQRVMPAFVRYLNTLGTHNYSLENNDSYYTGDQLGDGRYWKSTISVQSPEHINDFAAKFGCNGEHLKAWNKLSTNYLTAGQIVSLWHPVFVQKHQSGRIQAPVQPQDKNRKPEIATAPGKKPAATPVEPMAAPAFRRDESQPAQYQYHTVQRNESLEDVARQYATSVESLRKINNLESVKVGMRLKIRQF
ncbi:MAG: transglycosylase SLT domain-containing protein, partial [Saprospiraceae bacterium]